MPQIILHESCYYGKTLTLYSVYVLYFIWHVNLNIPNHWCVHAVQYIAEGWYSVDCKVTIREIANTFRQEQYAHSNIWIINLACFYYFCLLHFWYWEFWETSLSTLMVLNVCLDWHPDTELFKIIIDTIFQIMSSLFLHHYYLFRRLFWSKINISTEGQWNLWPVNIAFLLKGERLSLN